MQAAVTEIEELPPLTAEQQEVFDEVSWTHKYRPYTTIGGYAGTGKSVLLGYLHKAYPNWVVCSPNWQTVNVLRMRGIPATTVYRVLYKRAIASVSNYGRVTLDFESRHPIDLEQVEGILCDEAGQITTKVHQNLLELGKPIIYLGDHGQLPPINDSLELLAKPHYVLEEIHRNASDIVRFSMWLRQGHNARDFDFSNCKTVQLVNEMQAQRLYTSVDQIACSYNKTRMEINFETRAYLGRRERLETGDRIVTLSNHRDFDVFNGMAGEVTSIDWDHGWLSMRTKHFGMRSFEADFSTLDEERPQARAFVNSVAIAYAYARTAYSLQGSECGSLLVIEERSKGNWPQARANYTLATRAKEMLYWRPK